MKLSKSVNIAWNNLTRRRLRTLLTVLGIGVAVGVLFVLVNGVASVKNHIIKINRERPDVTRMMALAKGEKGAKIINDASIEELKKINGVTNVYPIAPLVMTDFVSYDIGIVSSKTEDTFNIFTSTPADAVMIAKNRADKDSIVKKGQFFTDSTQEGVIISESLAKKIQAQVGNYVSVKAYRTLRVTQPDGSVSKEKSFITEAPLKVIGILDESKLDMDRFEQIKTDEDAETSDIALVGGESAKKFWESILPLINAGLAPEDQAELGFAKGEYAAAGVLVKDFDAVTGVDKKVTDLGFETNNVAKEIAVIEANFAIMQMVVIIVGLIGIIIAFFNITNTMYMSVLERRHEIGIYKALGMQNKYVRRIFMTEAGILGLGGALIGIIVATVLGGILAQIATEFLIGQWISADVLESVGMTPDFVISYQTDWLIVGLTVIFSMLVAILASALPAHRAAKLNPVDAIHAD